MGNIRKKGGTGLGLVERLEASEWRGMPEFSVEDMQAWRQLLVSFECVDDMMDFGRLVGQKLSVKTRSIWHPAAECRYGHSKFYVDAEGRNPRYPVYVISKGRWESRLTSKTLEEMRVPYRIIVEPQERDEYASVIDPEKILVLPFSNLGQGSIPARNWVWDHSISEGHERHWILDDNIRNFYRLNRNVYHPVRTGVTFAAAEDFVDRYENVGLAGMQYKMFATQRTLWPPFILNTRIYSCILIRNDLPYRWRGRYNEDTDLSLRVLKDGLCTVLFYAFLADKMPTLTMKGGNTDELYAAEDSRLRMAQSLVEQHPDVTTVYRRWGRWQHLVDYSGFKRNRLRPRRGVTVPDGVDDYGMELIQATSLDEWRRRHQWKSKGRGRSRGTRRT